MDPATIMCAAAVARVNYNPGIESFPIFVKMRKYEDEEERSERDRADRAASDSRGPPA